MPETKPTWPTWRERSTWRTWEIGWIRISNKTSRERRGSSAVHWHCWREIKTTKHSSWIKLGWLYFYFFLAVASSLKCVINLVLFRINVLECSANNSYNIVNIFKSFLSLSKIDFGVLNGGETERWENSELQLKIQYDLHQIKGYIPSKLPINKWNWNCNIDIKDVSLVPTVFRINPLVLWTYFRFVHWIKS